MLLQVPKPSSIRSFLARAAGLILLALAVVPAGAPAAELELAAMDWPPFTGEGDESRFAIELAHEALARSGYQASTLIVEGGLMEALKEGLYDGSPVLWKNAAREEYLLFSRPYLENRLVLVGRKGADVGAASFDDLDGVKIALVEGFAYGEEVTGAQGPVFVEGRDEQQNLERLLSGEVDLMLVDELLIQYVLEYQAEDAERFLEIGSNPLVRKSLHLAVRKSLEGAEELIGKFNDAIWTMLSDGTYNRILRLNYLRADVDGDGSLELVRGRFGGREAPRTSYDLLFSQEELESAKTTGPIWIEGKLYSDWDEVPDSYKLLDPHQDEPPADAVTLFKFTF